MTLLLPIYWGCHTYTQSTWSNLKFISIKLGIWRWIFTRLFWPFPWQSSFTIYYQWKPKGKGNLLLCPNAEGGLPLIGHVHLFGGPSPLHQVLGKMADRNGPIFGIKMGIHKAVIVNSWEMAKECLTVNDKAIAGRPRMIFFEVMTYNSMFRFSTYGPYWWYIRRWWWPRSYRTTAWDCSSM